MLRPQTILSRRRFVLGLGAAPGAVWVALASPGRALAATPIAALTPPPTLGKSPTVPTVPPPPPPERWLQNHRPTNVFADPDGANVVATAPQWSYFKVAGAQVRARIPVIDPRFGAQVWIDATAVGPSGPPPPPGAAATAPGAASAPAPAPAPAPPKFDPFWIAPFKDAPLLVEPKPDATLLTTIAQFAPLKVTGPAKGNFYPVEEPFVKAAGWIDATAIGKIGDPCPAPAMCWWGNVVADEANARAAPSRDADVVATYKQGQVLGFVNWVAGEEVTWDDPAWGQVADGVFVYGRLTRPTPIEAPPPPRLPSIPSGKWIGINRTIQIVVAYVDDKPQFWARTSTGRPGWETPLGTFSILRRSMNETMDSSTLLGKDAERANYKIENVKFTQYFTNDGNAIHENWWKDPDTFGLPSSHGCAGLPTRDAQRFWDFGDWGMPVIVHL